MKHSQKGFTIIELIVVIAIIALLAAIVLTNVSTFLARAKVARAKADVANIEKALDAFYAQYGNWPTEPLGWGNATEFYPPMADGGFGEGDPYLVVNGTPRYLSSILNLGYTNYDATYLNPTGFYYVWLSDSNSDGKPDCSYIEIYDNQGGLWHYYGGKEIMGTDGCAPEYAISATPY